MKMKLEAADGVEVRAGAGAEAEAVDERSQRDDDTNVAVHAVLTNGQT